MQLFLYFLKDKLIRLNVECIQKWLMELSQLWLILIIFNSLASIWKYSSFLLSFIILINLDGLLRYVCSKKTRSYFLCGLDKMELLDNNVFQGKFMGASDSLVFFKTELDGGKILEQNLSSIKNLVLEKNNSVFSSNIFETILIYLSDNIDNFLEQSFSNFSGLSIEKFKTNEQY